MPDEIILNRILLIIAIALAGATLYILGINPVWYAYIVVVGFFIPLFIMRLTRYGMVQQTIVFNISSLVFMVFTVLYIASHYAVYVSAFLPEVFDMFAFQLFQFSQITNEQWLAPNFAMKTLAIPFLMGTCILFLFEKPVVVKRRYKTNVNVK